MVDVDPIDANDANDADDGGDELDLTPRNRDAQKRGSRSVPTAVIVVLLAVIGFVLFQGLSGATLSVRTADQAVVDRGDTGDRRFRITGSPIAVTDENYELNGETAVRFSIACDGVAVDIVHRGNVAEAFQLGVPVVLEGRWADAAAVGEPWDAGANDGYYFDSDRMLVEHDNEYREDRIEEASSCGGDAPDAPEAAGA